MRPTSVAWIACLILASCGPGSDPSQPITLRLTGKINEKMLAEVRAVDFSQVDDISIASDGGRPFIAREISKLIARSGKPLKIYGVCRWPCSMIVLSVPNKVEISPESSVTFEETATSLYYAFRGSHPQMSRIVLEEDMDAELAQFRESGLRREFLLVSLLQLKVSCFDRSFEDSPEEFRKIAYAAEYASWIPNERDLGKMRISGSAAPLPGIEALRSQVVGSGETYKYERSNHGGVPVHLDQNFEELTSVVAHIPSCAASQ